MIDGKKSPRKKKIVIITTECNDSDESPESESIDSIEDNALDKSSMVEELQVDSQEPTGTTENQNTQIEEDNQCEKVEKVNLPLKEKKQKATTASKEVSKEKKAQPKRNVKAGGKTTVKKGTNIKNPSTGQSVIQDDNMNGNANNDGKVEVKKKSPVNKKNTSVKKKKGPAPKPKKNTQKANVNRRPDWEDEETNQCVNESNGKKLQLRGSFKGPGGSRGRKRAGWKEVTGELN